MFEVRTVWVAMNLRRPKTFFLAVSGSVSVGDESKGQRRHSGLPPNEDSV